MYSATFCNFWFRIGESGVSLVPPLASTGLVYAWTVLNFFGTVDGIKPNLTYLSNVQVCSDFKYALLFACFLDVQGDIDLIWFDLIGSAGRLPDKLGVKRTRYLFLVEPFGRSGVAFAQRLQFKIGHLDIGRSLIAIGKGEVALDITQGFFVQAELTTE